MNFGKNKKLVFIVGVAVLLLALYFITSGAGSQHSIAGINDTWYFFNEPFFAVPIAPLGYRFEEHTYDASSAGYYKEYYNTVENNTTKAFLTTSLKFDLRKQENTTEYFVKARATQTHSGSGRLYYSSTCYSSWGNFWNAANCTVNGCSGLTSVGSFSAGSPVTHQKTLISKSGTGSFGGCPTYVLWSKSSLDLGMRIASAEGATTRLDIVIECGSGQTKCDGTTYYTCSTSNKWVSQGKVAGKCGIQCTSNSNCSSNQYCSNYTCQNNTCSVGEETCSGSDYSVCRASSSGNYWSSAIPTQGKCGVVCIDGEQCSGTTLQVCQNYNWVNQGIVQGKCGVTCTSNGETKCDGTTYSVCENNVWASKGVVVGQCNVNCISGEKCVGFVNNVCENNQWIDKGNVIGKCNVACINLDVKCEGERYNVCESYKWRDYGPIGGKCGVVIVDPPNPIVELLNSLFDFIATILRSLGLN